ncbi:NtrZ family periplasmic regulatory protein [Caulobacter sp. S45]|uniref:NtrZ family periplasmic regulatory protein n=1 Tax=Caulobacter sp. S45 TaxID=1641861 RepID=UPI001576781B|nr:hypothetical protein [Caulobacter sp. S45]
MTGGRTYLAGGLAALLLLGVAGARAETVAASQNPNAFSPDGSGAPHKSLQLDASGRWTLRLDMDPPVGEVGSLKDVQAGAFFHITPSMRIGGSVGLGDRQADVQRLLPQDTQGPRVHLETKFKF